MRHGLNAEQFVARACLVCLGVVACNVPKPRTGCDLPFVVLARLLGGTR